MDAMQSNFLITLFFALCTYSSRAEDCPRFYPKQAEKLSFVCSCSEERCSTPLSVPPLPPDLKPGRALFYRTAISGDRLARYTLKARRVKNAHHRPKSSPERLILNVNPSEQYQRIIGFGGAMTDAAAINIDSLTAPLREELLQAYFGENGIGYTVIRVPIASCDFSTREYSYAEQIGDLNLTSFALVEEDELKADYMRRAMEIAAGTGRRVKIFGSPWSPPGWMKTTGRMQGGGAFMPGKQYAEAYAKYFVKFIESYAALDVPIWAVTIQNEPSTGVVPDWGWQTMFFPPQLQQSFVRDHLKPALLASEAAFATRIMIHDDFRNNLPEWADEILADPETDSAVDGIAVHWYNDARTSPQRLDDTFRRHPDKFILGTEACYTRGPRLGDFFRAIGYAKDIIEDLNHYVSGWVDWNLAVDRQGGPNWVRNFVDSPIIVDSAKQRFFKQPMFYVMGQFSRFISPGAVRIDLDWNIRLFPDVTATAAKNPDGSIVVVALNNRAKAIRTEIRDARTRMSLELLPRSINTVIYRPYSRGRFG